MTAHAYGENFVLSLSLILLRGNPHTAGESAVRWLSIVALAERTAREVDRSARETYGTGMGSTLVLEMKVMEVDVAVEWKL